jgi:hypothetical protein
MLSSGMDPLDALVCTLSSDAIWKVDSSLERVALPDFAWLVEWASDGSLDRAWAASRDPAAMFVLLAWVPDRQRLLRAGAAIAWELVPELAPAMRRPARALVVRVERAADGGPTAWKALGELPDYGITYNDRRPVHKKTTRSAEAYHAFLQLSGLGYDCEPAPTALAFAKRSSFAGLTDHVAADLVRAVGAPPLQAFMELPTCPDE